MVPQQRPKGKGGRWPWGVGLATLIAAAVLTTQAFAASMTVTAQPLQNTGTDGKITYSTNYSGASSVVTRHESSAVTANASNQVTALTVGGTKATGASKVNVTLKDKDGATLDTGSGTLSTASGTYSKAITMPGSVVYNRIATIATDYPAPSSASLTSVADSFVTQDASSSNYGTLATMDVQSRKTSKNRRSFVRFDVSSIAAGSTVNSATLTLCASSVTNNRTYNVHRVTASWVETSITWSNQPSVAASATSSATTPPSPSCMTWSVTSDVQAWVDGTANNGLRISDNTEDSGGTSLTTYATRENDTAGNRPNLSVTYVTP